MVSESLITDYQHLYFTYRNARISREQALEECSRILNLWIEVMKAQHALRTANALQRTIELLLQSTQHSHA